MEEKTNKNSNEKADNNTIDKDSKLKALLMDEELGISTHETPEEAASYEAFMKDYHKLIGKVTEEEEDESDFLISLPRRSKRGQRSTLYPENKVENKDWNDEITLAPEEYDDPGEEDRIMVDELPEENEPTPDFNLGQEADDSDDKFQLSINFTGESKKESVPEPKERKYDPDHPRFIDWVFDFAEMIVFVLLTVMMLNAFVFKHAVVDGPSMNNTLQHGEHLIVSDLFYTPKRGDIIVFEDYSTSLRKPVVKRVIGLPNETVEVKLSDNGDILVYVNGTLLEEDYAFNAKDCAPFIGSVTVVGEDEVFVMGDNRYHSTDSREPSVGPIKIDSILGKVLFRFYPFDRFGTVE